MSGDSVPPMRVTVVSDTHLSARTPEAGTNWAAVVHYVAETQPDLVVHLGDLTCAGSDDPAELAGGRLLLDQLSVPWRAIPGNHDIGDNLGNGTPPEGTVEPSRLAAWRDAIGADWWSLEVGGWKLVAINAQLFGSGLDDEAAQWSWLDAELERTQDTIFLSHKPIAADDAELRVSPGHRFVPDPGRTRLRRMLSADDLVVSGHVHQSRALDIEGQRHVWAPTAWAAVPDAIQALIPGASKRCGIVDIVLPAAGLPTTQVVEPPGLVQHTAGQDIPSPYA